MRFVSDGGATATTSGTTTGDTGLRASVSPCGSPRCITGTVDVPETALRDRLKVSRKDFDFFRWQEDRSRIEQQLREDAHFEARVSAAGQ